MSGLLGVSVLELRTDQRQLDSGLASAKAKTNAAGAEMQRSFDRRMVSMGASMQRASHSLTWNLTVPIAAVEIAAGKMASEFDSAMEKVHTQAGATQRSVNQLRGEVLNLAKVSAFGPTELANALFRIEGAGVRGAKAMQALSASAKLAAVGQANVEDTAKAVAEVLSSGIKGGKDFNNVVAQLNATVGAGDLRLQGLVDALGVNLLPTAATVGLTLKDVTAAIAVFGDQTNNVSGDTAQLATALHYLTNPSAKATAALKTMGITSGQLIDDLHKPQGLLIALTTLKDGLEKLPGGPKSTMAIQTLGDILPGGRGRIITDLLTNLDRLQAKYGQVASTTKNFNKDVVATQHTSSYQIHQLWSDTQVALVKIGHDVLPELLHVGKDIADDAVKVADAFSKLPPGVQHTLITGGLIAAGIGPAMKIAGLFTSGVGKLITAERIAVGLARTGSWKTATGNVTGKGLAATSVIEVADMNVARLVVASMAGGLPVSSARPGLSIPGTPTSRPSAGEVPATTTTMAVGGEASAMSRAGSIALRGLGALGVAAFAVPLALGLKDAISTWSHNDAMDEGRAWATRFLKPLPKAIQDHFHEGLAQTAANTQKDKYLYQISGLHPTRGGTATGARDPQLLKQLQHDFEQQGRVAGEATVKGLQSVKDPSTVLLFRDFRAQLAKLPTQARPAAAKVMVEYAEQLEKSGKIPTAAVQRLIGQLTAVMGPKFRQSLFQQGLATDQGFAKTLKFDQASHTLTRTLDDFRTQFGDFAISTKITGSNINQNAETAMKDLHQIIRTSVGQTRKDAIAELHLFQRQTGATFDAMLGKTQSSMSQMGKFIQAGTKNAASIGSQNMWGFASSVFGAMKSGALSTTKGAQLIAKALNATLQAFGSKPIPVSALDTATLTAGLIGAGAGGIGTAAGHAGQGAASALGNLTVPTTAGVGAAGSGAATGAHAARGKLIQIGREGERGRDMVPMSIGGSNIIVGRGEKVAVFNASQQREMDAGLAARGYNGLNGLFSRVRKPHYMAEGGLAPGFASGGTFQPIHSPQVSGGGTVSTLVRDAMRKLTGAANRYEQAHLPQIGSVGLLKGGRREPLTGSPLLRAMIAEANAIASHSFNYEWGGGHGSLGVPGHGTGHGSGPGIGFDCSGAVSAVLGAAHLLSSPLVASDFMSWGEQGPGKQVSIYASPSHTFMQLAGHYFGTSSAENPGGGANWIPTFPESMPSVRHPKGFAGGGWVLNARELPAEDRLRLMRNRWATLPGMASGGLVGRGRQVLPPPSGSTVAGKPSEKAWHQYLKTMHRYWSLLDTAGYLPEGKRFPTIQLDQPPRSQGWTTTWTTGDDHHVHIPWWFVNNQDNPDWSSYANFAGAYEMGHSMQSSPVLNAVLRISEGGDTAWSDIAFPKAGIPLTRSNQFEPFADWVRKTKGMGWILHGQFGDAAKHASGGMVRGRVSTFGPPGEAAGSTYTGRSSSDPGISLRRPGTTWNDPQNHALLNHLFDVVIGSHRGRFMDIDLGPNESTGRSIDVTGRAASMMGLNPLAFPTDSIGTASMVTADSHRHPADHSPHAHHRARGSGLSYASGPAARALAGAIGHLPNPIKTGIKTIDGLMASVGDSGALPDLINYTSQQDDATVQDWVNRTPGLDGSTGLVTPPDGSQPYIDYPFVQMRLGELHQLYAWQVQVKNKLQRAANLIGTAGTPGKIVRLVMRQIALRKAQAEKLKKKIRENIHRITDLRKTLTTIRGKSAAVSPATLAKQRASLESQLRGERAKSEPYPSPKTAAQRAANAAFRNTQKQREVQLEDAMTNLSASALGKNETARSAQKKRETSIENLITSLEAENRTLGGNTTTVGTRGQIAGLGISNLEKQLKALTSDRTSLIGPSGIGGLLGDARLALLSTGTIPGQLFALADPQLAATLAAASSSSTSTSSDSQLVSLLQQELQTSQENLAVSQAQYGTLQSLGKLPPFGGSFALGGMVPGPIGAARTVIAHGGELISPNGEGGGTVVENHTHISPKGGLNDLIDVRVEQRTRKMAREAGRRLPGRGGGGLGR